MKHVICNIFLNYMETKCAMEIKKYIKFGAKKKKKKLSYLARYKLSILIITLVKIELNIIEIDHTE